MWPRTACTLPRNLNKLLLPITIVPSEFDSLKADIKELIESSINNGMDKMKALVLEREHIVYDKFRDLEVEQSSIREHIEQKDREIMKIFSILDGVRDQERSQAAKVQDIISTMEAKYKMWNMIIAVAGVAAALVAFFAGR